LSSINPWALPKIWRSRGFIASTGIRWDGAGSRIALMERQSLETDQTSSKFEQFSELFIDYYYCYFFGNVTDSNHLKNTRFFTLFSKKKLQ
jgi:hypothetical protein